MKGSFGYIEGGSDAMDVRYVVDKAGKPRQVILDIEEYEELLERADDAEALAFLRQFESQPHEYVSLQEAFGELDNEFGEQGANP
jgi:hypothetical protein